MSTQPSVIQWSSVTKVLERETDTSKVNVPENSIHEVDKWSGNSERIITVPIKKSKDNKSGITEYLDVQIEVLSEINADDDKIVTDPKEEYFDVRIEVESDVCTQPMIKNKISLDNSVQKKIKDRRKASSLYKSKPYICSSCGKCFSTRQHVERHSNLHSKETLYPCPECEKVLLDRSYLLRHMKVHAEVKSFTCSICDKKFCTASSVKRHITTHDPSLRPYCCSDCDKRFPDNSSLKKHSLIHSGVKTHICIICAKGFSHVGDYNAHLKGHEVVKQYRCDQCGKDFSRHNNLVRHKAVHADSNFQCVICKGCFQHASTLTRHILSCHPGTARVRKKRAGSQACENSSPESSLQNGVTTQKCSGMVSENIISGSTTEDVALASLDDSEGNYCKDVNSESCRNLTDHAELDQPSFEIFQFDASGTLVKVTEAVPLQVFNSCREQPYSIL